MCLIMRALVVCAFVGLAAPANAQFFNVDFSAGSGNPATLAPSNSYGAAAGEPDFWNNITIAGGTFPLSNLLGNPTAVTLNMTPGGFMFDSSNFSNGTLTPPGSDEELLMDDVWDPPANAQITINNLLGGTYRLVVYGGSPDSATTFMQFIIDAESHIVAGGWPNPFDYADGVTHTTFLLN
jgi:hypothetical protein